jgi:hypothetical protein
MKSQSHAAPQANPDAGLPRSAADSWLNFKRKRDPT